MVVLSPPKNVSLFFSLSTSTPLVCFLFSSYLFNIFFTLFQISHLSYLSSIFFYFNLFFKFLSFPPHITLFPSTFFYFIFLLFFFLSSLYILFLLFINFFPLHSSENQWFDNFNHIFPFFYLLSFPVER